MKWGVIDTAFTNPKWSSVSAQWLRWEAARAGAELVQPPDADGLLVTVGSQQSAVQARSAIKRARGASKVIVVGGAGAYAPAVFDSIADVVCVGEGRGFIRALMSRGLDAAMSRSEAWIPGDVRPVVPDQTFPWDVPPILHPDGRYRVFESRGCRHKCLFCQTGWARDYIQNPDMAGLKRQCKELGRRGLQYDLVTNDAGTSNLFGTKLASFRYQTIKDMPPGKLPPTVRIGVEGVSERLRRAVGKPIPHEGLVRLCRRLMVTKQAVRLFYVIGLPFETMDDWSEFHEFIRDVGGEPKGIIHISLHAFIPEPATPLCVLPLADDYAEGEKDFLGRFIDGPLFTRRVNVMKPAGYETRLKRAKLSMAATEADLRRGWWHEDNLNWRVRYVAPPWKLRHMAAVYARHMGRQDAIPDKVNMVKP